MVMQNKRFAWGYGRVSTDRQEISIIRQQELCEMHFQIRQKSGSLEGFEWGGFLADPAVSGGVPWFERPFGEVLFRQLRAGDHIIVATKDRAFRSCIDACQCIDLLAEAGVRLHVLDVPVDLSTDEGRFFMQVMASFAELERKKISSRTRENFLQRAKMGLPMSGKAPWGWQVVGNPRHKRYVQNTEERRWCLEIVRLHNTGMTDMEVAWHLRKLGVKNHRTKSKEWRVCSIRSAMAAARLGFPLEFQRYSSHVYDVVRPTAFVRRAFQSRAPRFPSAAPAVS